MFAAYFVIRITLNRAGRGDAELVLVGQAQNQRRNPAFDPLVRDALAALQVVTSSAKRHRADSVEIWSYRLKDGPSREREALLVVVGDTVALGRLLHSRLSLDRYMPARWGNAAA